MQLTPKIKHALGVMRGHFTKRNILIAGAALVGLVFVVAYWPRTISFSYAGRKLHRPRERAAASWTPTVPNYKKDFRIGSPFSFASCAIIIIVQTKKQKCPNI